MSQLEHQFRQFLAKHPEIAKCCAAGLINRRSLMRHLIANNIGNAHQVDAIIAMLRRFDFGSPKKDSFYLLKEMRLQIKDGIMIVNFEKSKQLLSALHSLVSSTDYDKGDTLKIVLGTSTITVFVDQHKENMISHLLTSFKVNSRLDNVSEISHVCPHLVINTRGILALVTQELALNDIVVSELLTSSSELLIYVKQEYVLQTYEVLKRLQH